MRNISFSEISSISNRSDENSNFVENNKEDEKKEIIQFCRTFKKESNIFSSPIKKIKRKILFPPKKESKMYALTSAKNNLKSIIKINSNFKTNSETTKKNAKLNSQKIKSNKLNSDNTNKNLKTIIKPELKYISSEMENNISKQLNDYIKNIEILYNNRINKLKDIHKKYDKDLVQIKECVNDSNIQDVNALIFNGVLSDMNLELNDIDNEYNISKQKESLDFNDKINSIINNQVCNEIESSIYNLCFQIEGIHKNQK